MAEIDEKISKKLFEKNVLLHSLPRNTPNAL